MRLQILLRSWFSILFLAGLLLIMTAMTPIDASSASAAAAKKSKQAVTAAETTAQRYAEAMGAGNKVGVGQLDFACQYPLVATAPHASSAIRLIPTQSTTPAGSACKRPMHLPSSEPMSAWRSCGPVMANWSFSVKM